MIVGQAVYSILSTNASIQTLTNGNIATELTDQVQSYPQLVYKLADEPTEQDYQGPLSLQETKLSIYCLGLSDTVIETLSVAVFNLFSLTPPGVYSNVSIDGIFYEGSTDTIEKRPQNQNQTLYSREMQFRVWYQMT